ncbi:MAG: exoF3 [Cereibacter sp.]|jgi:exopolysaccharide production protein ExoF|nr:exoF3 [Cereibacter sp.]
MIAVLLGSGDLLASQEDYLINVGDQIELDILDDSDPSQKYTVGSDGSIQLPLIGGFRIAELSMEKAREKLYNAYVSREIYVNPTIAISVAAFRPVFVMGDVRAPGFYDFHPFLTAEQALGLAGGAMLLYDNEETRILERRNLTAQLSAVQTDLVRLAAKVARSEALLHERPEIDWNDVPKPVRDVLDPAAFQALKPKEDKILALERADHEVQKTLLASGIAEAESQLKLLTDRQTVQTDALAYDTEDLTRKRELAQSGLVTSSSLSQLERAAKAGEGQLLQILEQQSVLRRTLGELRREMSRLESARGQSLLSQAQDLQTEVEKKLGEYESVSDRIDLITQWMNAAVNANDAFRIEYEVRRRTVEQTVSLPVDGQAELLPGDLVVVAVRPPEGAEEMSQ